MPILRNITTPIGQRIIKTNLAVVETLYSIATSQGKPQQKHFKRMTRKIDQLKLYMRLSFECRLLKVKQMTYIFREITNIEKQLYLWQQSQKLC
ncbi:four helix bundle protein [Riemerella anatipestifer]|uniref:four helix bundle protein n=1 Tax=Riemerella anatipestifer TaxID=34085 RepID=UPI0021F8F8DC|nr:four helix bundle protein [Riemerella anatipestifer]MCW0487121.1 four helix bundle protein [Riemerella anatipestifer]